MPSSKVAKHGPPTNCYGGCDCAGVERMHGAWLSVEWEFQLAGVRRAPAIPIPSPPNDQFTWLTRQPLTSVIVPNPAGGKWVRTTPARAFIVDPDRMHQFLLASSEPFNFGGPQMRGTFSIRLVGPGKVSFGVRAVRGNVAGFIGGGELSSSPLGGGEVGVLTNAAGIDNLAAFEFRDFPVTSIGSYTPGQTAQFFYTIDQSSQTFTLSAGKGAQGSDQNVYSFSGGIQRLELWLFLRQPTAATVVFTNDVTMEELK
jgi:hypothetical protein